MIPSGNESSEQLVFDVPYSVLATGFLYYTICPHVCPICCECSARMDPSAHLDRKGEA